MYKPTSSPNWKPGFLDPDETFHLVYSGPIRNGTAGTMTPRSFNVWKAHSFALAFLDPLPETDYSSDAYRIAVNSSASVSTYFQLHDRYQDPYFAIVNKYITRDSVVADCGCGGGSLLDIVSGITAETIAIEPYEGYRIDLARRGHKTYSDVQNAVQDRGSSVDIALSIHVIEHTFDPVAYLRDIYQLLKPGGVAIVITPNLHDILLEIDPKRFAPFFFRRVHNYYFTLEALRRATALVNLVEVEPIFLHEFGLANCLLWLRNAEPSGRMALPQITPDLDASWRASLESKGLANQVGIVVKRL